MTTEKKFQEGRGVGNKFEQTSSLEASIVPMPPAHTDILLLHHLVQVMMQEATVEGKPGRGGCG